MIATGGSMLSSLSEKGISDNITTPKTSMIALIVVGCVALVISFLGCCGAIKESYPMLYSYGGVLLILFIIEIVAAGMIIGFKNDLKAEAIHGILDQMEHYRYNWANRTDEYNVVDDMQRSLHCCGAENVTDWNRIPPYNATGPSNYNYPSSCCLNALPGQECHTPFPTPCWQAIQDEISGSIRTLSGVSIAIAIIQFLSILASFVLAQHYKAEYDVV